MKVNQGSFAGAANRAAASCKVFYFCGPDEAGASAAAKQVIELLKDPGERVEMAGSDLRKDPVLLGDEARSNSLFGGTRHIFVRTSGDEALDAVGNLLLNLGEACPVVIIATSATDKSRIAKLLDKRDDALVAVFWPPDLRAVAGKVRQMGDAAGLRINGEFADRIARATRLDVRLAQSEVDKLALYLDASQQSPKTIDAEAYEAIGAVTEEDGLGPIVNTVLSGDLRGLPQELQRLRELSLNPVSVLLALERRASTLARIRAKVGPRGSLDKLGKGEKAQLGIFWREEREIRAQYARWPGARLDRLTRRLMDMHTRLIGDSAAGETLLLQELTQIARFAAPRARHH